MSATTSRAIEFHVAGGVRLVGDQRGVAEAPAVLLLHGGGQTRHAWTETAITLAARGWRVIALDLRGHGESDWAPDGNYEITDFASDVVTVVDSLSAAPFVVGASLGGIAALAAQGLVDRQLCAGVVLVDVAPRLEPAGIGRIVGFMTAYPDGFASLDEAASVIASYLPHRQRPTDLGGSARRFVSATTGGGVGGGTSASSPASATWPVEIRVRFASAPLRSSAMSASLPGNFRCPPCWYEGR